MFCFAKATFVWGEIQFNRFEGDTSPWKIKTLDIWWKKLDIEMNKPQLCKEPKYFSKITIKNAQTHNALEK